MSWRYNRLEDCYCVYIAWMQSTTFFKIGETCNALARLDALQSGSPTKTKYLFVARPPPKYTENLEKKLHNIAKNDRVSGEWFRLSALSLTKIMVYLGDIGASLLTHGELLQEWTEWELSRTPTDEEMSAAVNGCFNNRKQRQAEREGE